MASIAKLIGVNDEDIIIEAESMAAKDHARFIKPIFTR